MIKRLSEVISAALVGNKISRTPPKISFYMRKNISVVTAQNLQGSSGKQGNAKPEIKSGIVFYFFYSTRVY